MTKDEINCLLTLVDINKRPEYYGAYEDELAEMTEEELNEMAVWQPLTIKVNDKHITLTLKDKSWLSTHTASYTVHIKSAIAALENYNLPIGKISTIFTDYDASKNYYNFEIDYSYTKKYEFTNENWLAELKADYERIHGGLKSLGIDTICSIF
jgi:hypothetical protein